MAEIASRATTQRQSLVLDRTPSLRRAVALSGRRLRSLHSVPLYGVAGDVIGGVALVRGSEEPLDPGEWALFNSFAEQSARAFERSRRSELDHDLALRLQLSLLPETLPEIPGVKLTGHYRAGAEGLVVGGDWYDAVRRRDGVLVLCVGDVIGRGIGAATLMGRLRDAFRAHTYETASPAEVVRRLLRHESGAEMMVTLVCASFDPYSGELVYACAGHPPPLLVDEDARTVTRLDRAIRAPARGRGRRLDPGGTAHGARAGDARPLHRRPDRAPRREHRPRHRHPRRRGRRGPRRARSPGCSPR